MSLWDVVADLASDQPRYDPRWWCALISQVPSDGALAAALQGGREFREWGVLAHEMAALIDAVQVNTCVTARAAGAKKFPAPKSVWRPGQRQARKGVPLTKLLASRRLRTAQQVTQS